MAKSLSRSALLARELLGGIARRELRPGDPIDLPALGRRHGVSRTVVREALADLGGKGLVVARPKVGTTIAPESQWNLLDPALVTVAIAESGPDSMLAEASALRRVIEPALAAEAARDAGRSQRLAVLEAVRALADAIGAADRHRLLRGDLALHAAIADACGNRLLRSIDHALVPVRALHRQQWLGPVESVEPLGAPHHRMLALQTGLALAIARGDAQAASAHALAVATVSAELAAEADRPVTPAAASAPAAPGTTPSEPQRTRPDTAPLVARPPVHATAEAWPDTITMQPFAETMYMPVRRARLDVGLTMSSLPVPALLPDRPALAATSPVAS